MKKLILPLLLSILFTSCGTLKQSFSSFEEEELIITRKFVGVYLSYRHTGPKNYEGPNLIWIKTSSENTYGKISAFGKTCEFKLGEKLYLRRTYFNPAMSSGYWIYTIENDSSVSYKATELQHDKGVYLKEWFE